MSYVWSKDMETGNTVIDGQHKQLVQAFNSLMDACLKGNASGNIEQTLKFLTDYTVKHFSDEERIQMQCGYPGYAEHKKIHENFKRNVGALTQKLKTNGPTAETVVEVNQTIGQWLINHIKHEDKKIAEHIRCTK